MPTNENTYTYMQQQITERKANYWRGFIACLILTTLPLTIAFIVFCHYIINTLN